MTDRGRSRRKRRFDGLTAIVLPVVLLGLPVGLVITACATARPALRHQDATPLRTVDRDATDDAFTVIFIGDPEARMRGNTAEELGEYVGRLLALGETRQEWFRIGDGRTHRIDPALVIIGGDISRDRQTSIELDMPIWEPFFSAGIPVLAGFGNHDWEPESWGAAPNRTGSPTPPLDRSTIPIAIRSRRDWNPPSPRSRRRMHPTPSSRPSASDSPTGGTRRLPPNDDC